MDLSFYEPLYEITADAGVLVRGRSPEELLCNAVLAAVNEMVDLPKVKAREEVLLGVESAGFPYLLADAVNEVLYLFDSKKFVPKECKVLELSPDGTKAVLLLKGETYDPERHGKKLLLKAATYHRLEVKKKNGEYEAKVVFDI
ncbi:MAG: archease [Aquificae bacterium]|nr:archease [Aquificota bacterium]